MSRRKHRDSGPGETNPQEATDLPERWAPPIARGWQLSLAAGCVLAWLAVLAYMACYFG